MRAALKDGEVDMKSANSKELQIRTLIDGMANAIRTKDVNALMACYAPDVVAFDLLPPLQYAGAEAIRKRVSQWLSSFQGSVGFEMCNLSITTGDDVAFCHSLNGVSGTSKDGSKIDMWWRATNCLRKIESKWFITHGHSSEPFDMVSGKALLDLKP
jgi:uncharacterized protein (TIGR02246 family)